MENETDTTDEEAVRQKGRQMITGIVRLAGAVFILAGTALASDLGGIGSVIGFTDEPMRIIFGGVIIVAGIFDYLVFPVILDKLSNRTKQPEKPE